MPEGRTHNTYKVCVEAELRSSLLGCRDSFRGSLVFLFELFGVGFSPCLETQLPLLKKFPDDDHIVPEHILGHSDTVHFDVRSEVLPSPDGVLVDRPIMGDDEGHHHHL